MRKNKKRKDILGFTLIEVLAVIVVLAIIALIATPIMLGVIENARRKAFEDSGYGIVEAVKQYYINEVTNDGIVGDNTFTFPNSGLDLSGTVPAGGTVNLYADGMIELAVHNNRWCATKAMNEDEITTVDYVEGKCKLTEPIFYRDFMSRGNVTTDKTKITSIEVVGTRKVPNDVIDSWDASEEKNGSVMAWIYEDENKEGYYKLCLGGNGRVYAPANSAALFRGSFSDDFQNLEILNISLLDTSKVTNMGAMFRGGSKLTSLDVSNFDTSNVTNMISMFGVCRKLTTLDVSNFDTSKVKYMSHMFRLCDKLIDLNIKNFTFDKVTSYEYIFANMPENATIKVGSNEAQSWIIALSSSNRPSSWTTENVVVV